MIIPEKTAELLNDPEAIKVLTTVSSEGTPHSIVVGTIMTPDKKKICAAEILMNVTANNLSLNKNIAVLVVKGTESYLVNAVVVERQSDGKLFDEISEKMQKAGMTTRGVWIFDPVTVYDQSAGPNAGTKICG